MRHYALSALLMAGLSMKEVAAFAGHTRTDTLERTYAHGVRRSRRDRAVAAALAGLEI